MVEIRFSVVYIAVSCQDGCVSNQHTEFPNGEEPAICWVWCWKGLVMVQSNVTRGNFFQDEMWISGRPIIKISTGRRWGLLVSKPVGSNLGWARTRWARRYTTLRKEVRMSCLCPWPIFFELCCARHYNCGSHWAVLNCHCWTTRSKGKVRNRKHTTNQNKTPNHPQHQATKTSLTNRVKVKPGETSSGSHGNLQSPALTTSSAGNSQRPMQCVVTQSRHRLRLASSSFSAS